METYIFHFPKSSVTQEKVLVKHDDYLAIRNDEDFNKKIKILVSGREWFTDKSPLHDAISTGILKHYGGESKCIVTKKK